MDYILKGASILLLFVLLTKIVMNVAYSVGEGFFQFFAAIWNRFRKSESK